MNTLARIPLILFLFATPLFAQFPQPEPLEKDLAIELLSLRDEVLKKNYSVSTILFGELKTGNFTNPHVARVTYFGPVLVDGKKIREICTDIFFWNEEYGWFLEDRGTRANKPTILIWSENKGEIELR